jgi:hypothetical protein
MTQAARWLKGREIGEGLPTPQVRPLIKCAKGVCDYDPLAGGMLHNQQYLEKFTYGIRGGCPYLKTIYLLNGD